MQTHTPAVISMVAMYVTNIKLIPCGLQSSYVAYNQAMWLTVKLAPLWLMIKLTPHALQLSGAL